MWPGFGDNMRVLNWILDRCEGKADAKETAIGYLPKAEDLDLTGLDIDAATLEELLSVDKDVWAGEIDGIREYFAQFGDKLPKAIADQLATLENNLK